MLDYLRFLFIKLKSHGISPKTPPQSSLIHFLNTMIRTGARNIKIEKVVIENIIGYIQDNLTQKCSVSYKSIEYL